EQGLPGGHGPETWGWQAGGMMTGSGRGEMAVSLRVEGGAAPGSPILGALEPGELAGPLEDALARACGELSRLAEAEVVSVYVREREEDGADVLVVRGNVGLAAGVIGNLRLRVGDGIVGWAAECLRPIAVGAADADPHFKRVRGIGEEQFPVLLALPLVRAGRCLGVLVFQRAAARGFSPVEIRLASL